MKVLLGLVSVVCCCGTLLFGQTTVTGRAKTSGPCSPAVSGSNNRFTITCQGVSDEMGAQLVELMNRIASRQLDAQAVMEKLDGCLAGVSEVREQQQPWTLGESQKTKMIDILKTRKSSAKVIVEALFNDSNAVRMGNDIVSVLTASGWNVDGLHMTTLNPGLVGVVLVVRNQQFPDAAFLQKALMDNGLVAWAQEDPAHTVVFNDNTIVIAIGIKPPAISAKPSATN